MRRKVSVIMLLVLFLCGSVKAADVYELKITSGSIVTSGGFSGDGFGTFAASGTITLQIDGDKIEFPQAKINTTPYMNYRKFQSEFLNYPGTFDGLNFTATNEISDSFPPTEYHGTFDGTVLDITGVYHEAIYDGYQFHFTLRATVVSEVLPAAQANNGFACDLYAMLKENEGNLFISPYSISTVLSMAYGGARGETAEQMAEVLNLPTEYQDDPDQWHESMGNLISYLNDQGQLGNFELSVANSFWGQQGYNFLQDYQDLRDYSRLTLSPKLKPLGKSSIPGWKIRLIRKLKICSHPDP